MSESPNPQNKQRSNTTKVKQSNIKEKDGEAE
jgi:hypothetical protein